VLVILGIVGILIGASFAAVARRFPAHELSMERWGGGIFIGGLAMIGFAFPAL